MQATIITIGDEILSGNTVDTNSTYIAEKLKSIGIKTVQIFTISDEIETIKKTLKSALKMVDLAITTGGLGPTRDDKTKTAFKEFFDDELVLDELTFEHLKQLLIKRKREHLLEINKDQAVVLSKATIFQNHNGTAPCQMIEEKGKTVICLPGVPFEVKPFISNQIVPYLQQKYELNFIETRIISVVDFPESLLALTIEKWEDQLPKNITLSYLPIANRVKLKLTNTGNNLEKIKSELETEVQKVLPIIGDRVIATNHEGIEYILHDLLIKNNLTLSVAESCTGGALSNLITSVSGASQYFVGSVIPYDYHQKTKILGVNPETIQSKTVVSEEVAQEMTLGLQKLFNTDISLSTTGVAGPNSDEFNTEKGNVYYSIRVKNIEKTFHLFLPHLDRKDFMNFVSQKVLQDLIIILVKTN
jgi:nicotinamide-nucleotide amidase